MRFRRTLAVSLAALTCSLMAVVITNRAASAAPTDFPAHLNCNGSHAGSKVFPGDALDACFLYSDDTTNVFFSANTVYTVGLTLPAGITLTSCNDSAGNWTAAMGDSTHCTFTETKTQNLGFPVGSLSLAVASTTAVGSTITGVAFFSAFPQQNLPVNGPGATVSAPVTATATAKAKATATAVGGKVLPDTGAANGGFPLGGALLLLVVGGGLLGFAVRGRRDDLA